MTKKSLVVLTVVVMGLGLLGWRYLRPPASPLKVTLVEQGTRMTYDPVYQNLYLYGILHAEDNAAQIAGRDVQQDEFLWEVRGARYRPNAQSPWQDVPPLPYNKVSSWPVVYSMKIDFSYYLVQRFADKPGDWQISVRHIRNYTKRSGLRLLRWRGSADYLWSFSLPKLPPRRDDSLVPGQAYVGAIEWNFNDGWQEIPQAGQPGFPLTLTARHMVDLRAVRKNPNRPWPDRGKEEKPWPHWKGVGVDAFGNGDAMINCDNPALLSRHARDFKTISAICGNTLTRQILVLPKPDIFVYEPTEVLSQSKSKKTMTLPIEAKVVWTSEWHPPIKVRFAAYKALNARDPNAPVGEPIGQINGPSAKDDVIILPGDEGMAKATLTLPENATNIKLKAILVIPNNNSEFHIANFNAAELRR